MGLNFMNIRVLPVIYKAYRCTENFLNNLYVRLLFQMSVIEFEIIIFLCEKGYQEVHAQLGSRLCEPLRSRAVL